MIAWAAGAVWRWATDQCPGGRKTTAVAIKGAVLILVGGMIGLYYAAPLAWHEYQDFRGSITTLAHAVEIQGIKDAAADVERDRRLSNVESQVLDHERRISRIEGRAP